MLKYLIALYFSAYSQISYIEIKKIKETDRDFVFQLENNSVDTKVLLDCASFFHYLGIQNSENQYNFYLTTSECWDIYHDLYPLPEERRCLSYTKSYLEFDDCSFHHLTNRNF